MNITNIASSFIFGTQSILPFIMLMSAFFSFVSLVSARILYLREKRNPMQVAPRPTPQVGGSGHTVVYGSDQHGVSGEKALRLPTGELRCTKCGIVNGPKSKKCRNCGSEF